MENHIKRSVGNALFVGAWLSAATAIGSLIYSSENEPEAPPVMGTIERVEHVIEEVTSLDEIAESSLIADTLQERLETLRTSPELSDYAKQLEKWEPVQNAAVFAFLYGLFASAFFYVGGRYLKEF